MRAPPGSTVRPSSMATSSALASRKTCRPSRSRCCGCWESREAERREAERREAKLRRTERRVANELKAHSPEQRADLAEAPIFRQLSLGLSLLRLLLAFRR